MKNWLDVVLLLQNACAILVDNVFLDLAPTLVTWSSLEKNALVFFYSLSVLRILRIFYLAKNFDTMKVRVREEGGGGR